MTGNAHYPPQDAIRVGISGKCPRCGGGSVFDGFLALNKQCPQCDLDLTFADTGDGPAIFVMLIIGFLVIGLALWVEVAFKPSLWVHFMLWLPLATLLCLGSLRAAKGIFIALQYKHDASEGRLKDKQ